MEERKYHGRTLSDAITNACADLGITSDKLSYKVIQEEKKGFLGLSIGARECIIEINERTEAPKQAAPKKTPAENKPVEQQPKRKPSVQQQEQQTGSDNSEKKADMREARPADKRNANGGRPQNRRNDKEQKNDAPKNRSRQSEGRTAAEERSFANDKKQSREERPRYEKTGTVTGDPVKTAEEFLTNLFKSMEMNISYKGEFRSENNELVVDLSGEDMGVLIGKRGQTLDALQYLTSQVVNKHQTAYIRVKIDTENYRERRRETMETLAQNIAQKVKRTGKPVALEPMNPYERRIIHSILQNEKDIITRSEGVEPYRHVIVCPAKRRRNAQDRNKNKNTDNEIKVQTQSEQAAPKTDENAEVKTAEAVSEA